ncbi:MAG TPA: glycosyltransferase family 39 protein [Vicinamibacterales bacterium]|nr:glycosyltransferase family 39 protein [Vicinamibacterales bacterium]
MAKRSTNKTRERPAPPPDAAPPGRRAAAIALTVFVLVFVGLALASYTQKSAVWDEPIHVTDGYVSLAQHDYRVDPEHPPFLRMWAALPLLALGTDPLDLAIIDRTAPTAWARTLFGVCERFLYGDNDAEKLLYAARFMIVLLGAGQGVLLFLWAREWLGFWPAAVALMGYTVEPNIAAHSTLVTTDLGFSCFMFATVYFLWRTARSPRWGNIAALVAAFVLAVVSKYSAVVLIPIVVLLTVFAAVTRTGLTPLKAAGLLVMLAAAAWVGIWASYGFRYAPGASPTWLYDFQSDPLVQAKVPGLAHIVTWIDRHHLFPNAFSQGFLFGQAKVEARSAFLAGEISNVGWWYYFPVAFAIKTPVALMALMAGGLGVAVARWRRFGIDTVVFVVVPIAVYLAFAMASKLNIGLRHILPIYPFALMLAAAAASALLGMRRRTGAVVLAALVALAAIEFGRTYPDNLAFFNVLVGGPDHGSEYLVDSNLDWGQDLKPLKQWMDANHVAHINLAYFGTAYPPYYKIDATLLPGSEYFEPGPNVQLPGYVAISATVLRGVYLDATAKAFYRPFLHMTPVASIGHSIFVYWVDRPWW